MAKEIKSPILGSIKVRRPIKNMNLKEKLSSLTLEEKQKCFNSLNTFNWPKTILGLDETSTTTGESPEAKELWKLIKADLTKFEISQGWWVFGMERTEEAHKLWWDSSDRLDPDCLEFGV